MAVEEKLLYLREGVRLKIEPCLNILAFFTSRCSPLFERLEKASKEAKNKSLAYVTKVNRPFHRYGGHIELIRFKEYYRMPRGHEHISFLFSSAFRDIFS